uniref:Secretin G protein-coupled receptor Mthl2 n=1 Tax=Tribolium castaneum TaxID=7070 RepID=A0A3T1FZU3_TRICA|nr:TPA_exp: secretin G protein-coupled receptor Mthl2 [Tribolium castaneum]
MDLDRDGGLVARGCYEDLAICAKHRCLRKCCPDGQSFVNGSKCRNTYEHGLDLAFTDRIVKPEESDESGLCIDVENSVALFQTTEGNLSKVRDLSDAGFYPKCCPLDYFYNRTTHGCVKSNEILEPFFREKFVTVGLPHCKVIIDIPTKSQNVQPFLEERKIKKGSYCLDQDQNKQFVLRICYDNYDVCDRIRCIRKCCPDGQSFINGSKCHNTFVHGLDLSAFSGNMDNVNGSFAIVHDGYNSPLYPLSPQTMEFYLDAKGVFRMEEKDEFVGKINVTKEYKVDENGYCMEHALKGSRNNYFIFRKYPDQKVQTKYVYTSIAMIISCVFLVLTILYYCFSNEKQTLFGKTLISYCFTYLLTFLLLSYFTLVEFAKGHYQTTCSVFAFFVLYATLATFFWMNILCIDIYWTFGSSKSFSSRQHRNKELKRFILYSLYGWGSPLVLTAIPLIFYHVDVLPSALQVIISEKKCVLYRGDGKYANFLFSTIPLTILEICNLTLFIKTVMYCLKVKKEINKMNDTQLIKGERSQKLNNFRDRFGLLLKLFLIMGISFLFEVVSGFYDFKKSETTIMVELIWDTFNCLQGLFIFLIFIVKKRIFKKFEKKVGLTKLRKFSFVSSAVTQTTSLPTLNKQ